MIFGLISMKSEHKFPCALCDISLMIEEFGPLSIQYCKCRHPPLICHCCRSRHPKFPVPPNCRWCGEVTTYKFESLKRNSFHPDRARIFAIEWLFIIWKEIRELKTDSQSLKRIQNSWTEFCNLLASYPSITARKILLSAKQQIFQSQMNFSRVGCHLSVQIRFPYVGMFFSHGVLNKTRALSISRKMIAKLFEKHVPIGIPGLLTQSYICQRPQTFFHKFMMNIIRRILAKIANE